MVGWPEAATVSLRIDFESDRESGQRRLGPGKIELLERIDRYGSVAAAGRSMAMSYRRAWELVGELNRLFDQALVTLQVGGRRGGGARLTPLGQELTRHYRAAELASLEAARSQLELLQTAIGASAP